VKKYQSLLISVMVLLLSACATRSASFVPPKVVAKLSNACEREAEFAARYAELRPTVIQNREWIEELMPEVWKTLEEFDPVARDIHDLVQLVCRFGAGEPVEDLLDAKRIDLQRKGFDWNTALQLATKIADLAL